MDKENSYSVFLDTWKPSGQLNHACSDAYSSDPLIEKRLIDGMSGESEALRTQYVPGIKVVSEDESATRGMCYIKQNQAMWSEGFHDYVTSKGIPSAKMQEFYEFFRECWIDGSSRRQDSDMAESIKKSIFDHDISLYGSSIREYVINPVSTTTRPFFTKKEMGIIFEANEGLLEVYLNDYIEHLDSHVLSTVSDLYVRRGVHMPTIKPFRIELNYLSSYSLALGPVEQFAQTYSSNTQGTGFPCIFSAPIPAVQKRTVAFCAFIPGMPINQFEIIVAPPLEKTCYNKFGIHGQIHEFEFL